MATDLKFIVDYSDIQVMRRELVGSAKDAKQSAGVFEREWSKAERQLQKTAKANQQFFNSVMGLDKATKDASRSADVFVKDIQRQEKATAAYSKETERLKLQYNTTYRAAQLFKGQLRDLSEAHSRGAISTDRHEQQVRELKNEYRAFLKDGGGPMNQFGQIASKNTRLMKRFGAVGMQQVGYQVQDFAVQVQGGTNALVALGQQGSQLLGILGPYGAIAGAVLAIGTGLANAFFSARKAADGMGKSVRELTKDIRGLTAAQNDNVRALQLGVTSEELSFIDRITLAKKDQEEAERQLAIRKEMAARQNEDAAQFYEREAKAVDKSKQAVAEYQQQYEEFLEGRELEKGLQKLKEVPDVATGLWGRLTDRIKESVDSIKEQTSEVSRLAINYEPLSASARSFKEETQANISNMVSVFENAEKLREELGDAAYESLRLSGVDMESGVDAAAKAAARLAADLNISLAAALAMQSMASKEEQVMSQPVVTGPATDRFGAEDLLGMGYTEEYLKAIGKIRDRTGGGAGGGGGGVSAAEKQAQEFEKLKRSLDDAYASSQKFKEGKDILDKALEAGIIPTTEEYKRLLGLLREEYDLTANKGDNFAEDMAKIAQKAKDAMGDAFMSIVDGSKSAGSAFKDMARIILKQAFDLLVVKPIMDGLFGQNPAQNGIGGLIGSVLGQKNGGAWNNGVQMFANGGVVTAPTGFQHSGGLGVMGEAGPEAIMPLKRGKNGKLGVQTEGGNQGNVTVENHFHIAANGDESVKRIIAQEAPRIANLTQKQILDQRRRGGVMKSTFGG